MVSETQVQPRPLTVAKTAHRLGCSSRTVLRLIERGCLVGPFTLQSAWRVPVESVELYKSSHGPCPSCPICRAASEKE